MSNNIRVTDTSARNNVLSISNIYFVLVTVIFVSISLVIGFMLYDSLPEQVVVQWGFDLQPTDVTDKSRFLIFLIPVFQIIIGFILTMTNRAIHNSKIALVSDSKEQLDMIIEKRLLSSKLVFCILVLVQVLHCYMQYIIFTQNIGLIKGVALFVIIIVIVSIYYGLKISKIKYPNIEYGWKNDYIYSDKNDASLFVEKKKGIGYTINFANKNAVIVIAGILILICIMVLLIVITLI